MNKYFKILEVVTTSKHVPDGYRNKEILTYKMRTSTNSDLDMIFNTKEEAEAMLSRHAENWTNYVIQEFYCNE